MSKNLRKVQDMLDGNYKNKIQVGYSKGEKTRKVGERWIDSDGIEWEQKHGYYTNVTKLAKRGIFDAHCKSCKKGIVKKWDKDVFKADGRCYYCQIDFEAELKTGKPLRWFAYRRLKDLVNMDALEKDMVQWIDEIEKERTKNPFDEKVANALANGEVEMSIKKNLQ
jgi:hypothetical protein